ncbi:hypothetical protein TBLA_0A06680 [Henningerozyma blattae CBS 6284]|uniref:KOW domain-containing protein n=1 Tax=Henningerozyma blattae (strain ATCC 34711 / CBS 6284 / DSM 70876 / NBRC 10599 / NRRL Y-10934 / UCD 77-7) TaxID=1071380 RepID=I2GWF8_HENB6|nr:hypothetical protein TBLA_0A06680 [Tetrapisispora blattae CBS 6284]CCH58460.1 hypothetical protein TBLA_0A06680 [Tetrapisispora blattae CBS 6284]
MFNLQTICKRCYQLPSKAGAKKLIKVYPPLTPKHASFSKIMQKLSEKHLNTKLDTTEEKRKLVQNLRAGDVVRITANNSYNNFVGYVLGVKRNFMKEDTMVVLRNQIGKNYVNVRLPIFSPNIERIDVIQKQKLKLKNGRQPRKHNFIQGTKIDTGSIERRK